MTKHCHASVPQIIHELTSAGALLTDDTIGCIQLHREQMIPHLQQMLATHPAQSEHLNYTRSHALVFLSSWRDDTTLSILADILLRHDDMLEDIYEILDATIPAYGSQAVPMLTHVLQNPHAPRASRIAVCSTLGLIAHVYPLTQRRIAQTLRMMLPHDDASPPYDYELWSWIVVTLTELRSSTLRTRIDQLFRNGMLDPSICGRPDEIRKSLTDKITRVTFADPVTLYTQYGA